MPAPIRYPTLTADSINDGLVGAWLVHGASGEYLGDAGPSAYHGALVNGPSRHRDVFGGFLTCDAASTEHVRIDDSVQSLDGTRTFAGTFRTTDATASNRALFSIGSSAGDGEYLWIYLNGNHKVATFISHATGDDLSIESSPSRNDGAWHTWALTITGSSGSLYVDGVPAGDDTYDVPSLSMDRSAIGALIRTSAGSGFTGDIADTRCWNRVLTTAELLALFTDPF